MTIAAIYNALLEIQSNLLLKKVYLGKYLY
jgi:hypothetical protein